MHGLIHLIYKKFILETFGEEAWTRCRQKANCSEEKLLCQEAHPDGTTTALFRAICESQFIEMEDLLERFGQFFVQHVAEEGYITFLQSLGRNLFEHLSNVNLLHDHVLRDHNTCVFPLLEVNSVSGDPNSDLHVFRVSYGSTRNFLNKFLIGILRGAALVLYNCTVEIEDSDRPEMGPTMPFQHAFQVTVHRNAHRASVLPFPEIAAKTAPQGNFFDFHSLIVSMWSSVSCAEVSSCCESSDGAAAPRLSHIYDLSPDVRSIVLEKQESIEKILEPYIPKDGDAASPSYDDLVKTSTGSDRLRLAAILFRGIGASQVAAPWTELDNRPEVSDFWDIQGHGDACYRSSKDWLGGDESMAQSRAKNGPIVFVSHCWSAPVGWAETIPNLTSFSQTKAAELCDYAKDVSAQLYEDASAWHKMGFWIDKACIPQSDPDMMSLCVNLLEEFIALSDGMIVLASWNYFSRLWCVYEWVCGLLIHSAMEIEILADPFIRDSTVDTYLFCIRNFSVAKCYCNNENDQQTLIDKVHSYYKSVSDFERFFQFSVIVCFSRCLVKRRTGKSGTLKPWIELAAACGFKDLALELRQLSKSVARFQKEAVQETTGGSTLELQVAFCSKVDDWFRQNIAPLLIIEQRKATNHLGIRYIRTLCSLAEEIKQSKEKLKDWCESSHDYSELTRSHRRALYSASFLPESMEFNDLGQSVAFKREGRPTVKRSQLTKPKLDLSPSGSQESVRESIQLDVSPLSTFVRSAALGVSSQEG